MIRHTKLLFTGITLLAFFSCKKHQETPQSSSTTSASTILSDVATNVIYGVYSDLYIKSISLDSAAQAFAANPSDASFSNVKSAWYNVRARYEMSECVLFGPAVYLNVDPSLDTWPVDTAGIDKIVNDTNSLTSSYAASLDPTLVGFHAVEFLLFGGNGQKTASEFSTRQLQYLTALTADARSNAQQLQEAWSATGQDYISNFTNAGQAGKSSYPTVNAAFQELVDASQSIAFQVAVQKIDSAMKYPYDQESYFSNNTKNDLIYNIQGIQNVYTGQYFSVKGAGLHDWVAPRNAKLDSTITAQINASITALVDMPCSFTDAISPSSLCNPQLKKAQAAIDTLSSTLQNKLIPFINQTITN